MRVRELTLKNYRVFDEPRTFAFGEGFTVVVGVNGRGKTAILDVLALLFSRLLPMISPDRSGYRTMSSSEVHLGAASAQLTIKVNCAGYPITYDFLYEKESRKVTATSLSTRVRQEIRKAYGDPSRANDAAPLAVYYTTDRAGYRVPQKLPKELPHGQAAAYAGALFNRRVSFRDFVARYRASLLLENEERQRNPHFLGDRSVIAISRAIEAFLEGFRNLRVQENPLRLVVDKNGQTLDLAQLSDGERSFIAIVCDLIRRLSLANPRLDSPLDGAGVVLIDELELHLHPRWQREIVGKLRTTFPHIQFVTTTHSPFIIQSLRPGELINLDPEEFGEYADRSIEDIAETVMGVEVPQKSERYQKMMEAAEEYFRLLREMPAQPAGAVEAARQRLNELAEPFSDDPAFQALLKVERETRSGPGSNETG